MPRPPHRQFPNQLLPLSQPLPPQLHSLFLRPPDLPPSPPQPRLRLRSRRRPNLRRPLEPHPLQNPHALSLALFVRGGSR